MHSINLIKIAFIKAGENKWRERERERVHCEQKGCEQKGAGAPPLLSFSVDKRLLPDNKLVFSPCVALTRNAWDATKIFELIAFAAIADVDGLPFRLREGVGDRAPKALGGVFKQRVAIPAACLQRLLEYLFDLRCGGPAR